MAFQSMQRYRRDWQHGYADGAISRFCELKDAGLAEAMASWRWQTRASLARAYKAGNLLDIFLTLRLVLVAIKSFLCVFTRVIFDRHTDIHLDVLEDAAPATAEQVQQSIPISRLVAWNRYARFSVDSHLTRKDIFLNAFNLCRSHTESDDERKGNLIVQADAREGGILVGTLRFARHLVLPI